MAANMRDPRRTYARIAPEITLFESAEKARAAVRAFRRSNWRSRRFWLALLLLMVAIGAVVAVLEFVALPFFRRHGAPSWLVGAAAGFVGGASFGYWMQIAMRRPLRRYLRETLVAAGVPVCLSCGYNLRGLTEPRCPECGAPFDEAFLENENRTRSVSDGP